MSKVIISGEELVNLKTMLLSPDKDNQQIAILAMENCNIAKSLDALYILTKFSGMTAAEMMAACPKVIKKLKAEKWLETNGNDSYVLPTMGTMYHVLISNKARMECLQVFLDLHGDYLLDTMKAWGYPVDKFELKIKIKDNV